MYKLIAIDLDGTLLNDDKNITEENIFVINKLIENGYEIVIATGRKYRSAKKLTNNISRHLTILANNGTVVRNSEDDKILFTKYLNIQDCKKIIDKGKEIPIYPIVHVNRYEDNIDLVIEDGKEDFDYLRNDKTIKKIEDISKIEEENILSVIYFEGKDIIYPFYERIESQNKDKYNIHIMENIRNNKVMLEIMNPRGSKWLSLIEYANDIGIKQEEIIAIGDDNNDVEMIANSGLGIAMKNATILAKKNAKIITQRNNNESGVASELRRIFNI